ncbi:glycerate kinase type-2 family protein [Methylobacterium nodulans]|uniref:MOFRL domain protein n=1 Tax=Methylobacterium nodulans (strain LMG 21967 / CNCM I-2342 / ORS 2060) TaxID=460265 RepID=B8IDW5_METNO|nr:glycerate kinase [Methylobacterium nodulans]ACL55687.1 MOFRL domain protein [Methylobacterium nodulans ORS 2060]
MTEPGDLLRRLFSAAVAAADPAVSLAQHLPEPPRGRTVVVGAGKAAAAMARAVEAAWPGEISGLVVTRYGHAAPTRRIAVVEAAHPVLDQAGEAAARRILDRVAGLDADDLVLCLISGGGSALLSLPGPDLSLADKQAVNRALLKSGAAIGEMNCVRRHLSAIKGGRLAAACHPARVVMLLISDTPGDNPLDIASGPTVADPTTCADALAILARYCVEVPSAVRAHLESGAGESIKPGDPRLGTPDVRMVATPLMALQAAAVLAEHEGVRACILGDALEGEAREVGRVMAGIALSAATHSLPVPAPCVLLSGGETTVTVRGSGRGGRNVEFLLALAAALGGRPQIHALAGDTDGVDGLKEIAGAVIAPDTPSRAAALGLSLTESLERNDGHGFFEALGDAVVAGPTLTNVNDFRAILIV